MRKGISSLLTGTLAAIGHIATSALLLGVAINFVNVIGRYFFHSSIEWAEESMIYLMLASVFLAAGVISLRGAHISMDMVLNVFPGRVKGLIEWLNDIIQITVAALVIWLSAPVIMQLFEFDQRSEALQMPIYIPQMAVPVGFGLIILAVILRRITR